MKRWLIASAAAVMMASIAGEAFSEPRMVNRAAFIEAVVDTNGRVETFDSFPEGTYATAIPLANGVYSAAAPWIYRATADNGVLSDSLDFATPRTFAGFPAGTRYWGADLGLPAEAKLRITIVGMTGTVTHDVAASDLEGFLGVVDPMGLLAVSIVLAESEDENPNMAFDNVTTSTGRRNKLAAAVAPATIETPAATPEPEPVVEVAEVVEAAPVVEVVEEVVVPPAPQADDAAVITEEDEEAALKKS